jgi:hypothetical protein
MTKPKVKSSIAVKAIVKPTTSKQQPVKKPVAVKTSTVVSNKKPITSPAVKSSVPVKTVIKPDSISVKDLFQTTVVTTTDITKPQQVTINPIVTKKDKISFNDVLPFIKK